MRCARGPRRPIEEPEVEDPAATIRRRGDSPRREREVDRRVTDLAGSDRQDVLAQHGEVAAVADLEFTRHTLYAADVRRVDALAIEGDRFGETLRSECVQATRPQDLGGDAHWRTRGEASDVDVTSGPFTRR